MHEKLEVSFDEAMIDSVTYNQWENTDRRTIMTLSTSDENFIEEFILFA